MKKHVSVIILLFLAITVNSQDKDRNPFERKNSIQLDFGGPGLFYSFNFESILLNKRQFKTASQVGLSYYPPMTGIRDVWIPIGLNELMSFNKHHVEMGIGYIVIREAIRDPENNPDEWFWSGLMSARIGYRYQKPDGRLILRAGFTPIMEHGTAHEIHPSGVISVGFNF